MLQLRGFDLQPGRQRADGMEKAASSCRFAEGHLSVISGHERTGDICRGNGGKGDKNVCLSDVRRLLSVWGHVIAAGAGCVFFLF